MKHIISITAALSTFIFGSVLVWLSLSDTHLITFTPNFEIRNEQESLLAGIRPTARGCGNGYIQAYELPNGKKIGESNDCYSSFNQARKEMNKWLTKADHIMATVKSSKPKDKPKSERVVASFPEGEFGNQWIRIMWVHGRCIHSIKAPDLEHALEFERSKFNPYKFAE